MPVPDRTEAAALEVLLEAREQVIEEMTDYANLFTAEVLREVFDQAWRSQFEEERRQARRAIRDVVGDSLASAELETPL